MLDLGQRRGVRSEAAPLTSPCRDTVPLQGSSHTHVRRSGSFSSVNVEGEDGVDMELDESQLSELRTLRNELRTALWTVDTCRPARSSVYRDPPPSLAPSMSALSSSPSRTTTRSSRSRKQGQGQRRSSVGSTKSVTSQGHSSDVGGGGGGTFLERLRDRCVAYFRGLAGQSVRSHFRPF